MQESPLSAADAPGAASWYLARGDKQYGPLGTRELLLLAERGGLKTNDLLWKPGFQSWKPVQEVCDLGAIPEIAAQQDPSPDHAAFLATDAAEVGPPPRARHRRRSGA